MLLLDALGPKFDERMGGGVVGGALPAGDLRGPSIGCRCGGGRLVGEGGGWCALGLCILSVCEAAVLL